VPVRSWAAFIFGVLVGLVAATAVLAASSNANTYMYENGRRVGYVWPASPAFWGIEECGGYTGGSVQATRRRLTVYTALADVLGSANFQRAGRWRIVGESFGGGEVDGLAIHKLNSVRWDVWNHGRKVGYTIGPNGPAAAAALLLLCS
jgi:hypothetical protein